MAWVGRKYKLEKSENFGDYMKALGEKFFIIFSVNHFVDTFDFSDSKKKHAMSHHYL